MLQMYHEIYVVISQILVCGTPFLTRLLPSILTSHSQVLLVLRTYALYGRSARILALLLGAGALAIGIGVVRRHSCSLRRSPLTHVYVRVRAVGYPRCPAHKSEHEHGLPRPRLPPRVRPTTLFSSHLRSRASLWHP